MEQQLPKELSIKILMNANTGVFIADFVDLGAVTEADSFPELVNNIHDLVFTFFDVPAKLRKLVRYFPSSFPKPKDFTTQEKVYLYKKFVDSDTRRVLFS